MKKIHYKLELLSSLMISPRGGHALYQGIDEFRKKPEAVSRKPGGLEKREVNVVYPFYQYGAYEAYDPENAEYYIPGSSVKGALLAQNNKNRNGIMADDISVPNGQIALRSLWKAQLLDDPGKAKFDLFFPNVGIEMIEGKSRFTGELYLEDSIEISEVLRTAGKVSQDKMRQMCGYLQKLENGGYKDNELLSVLRTVRRNLESCLKKEDILLLGGYKGLLHSLLMKKEENEVKSGIFIDFSTDLPHGMVRVESLA